MYHIGPPHATPPHVKPAYWDEATRTLGKRDRAAQADSRPTEVHLRRRNDPSRRSRAHRRPADLGQGRGSIWEAFRRDGRAHVKSTARCARSGLVAARASIRCACGTIGAQWYLATRAHFESGTLDPRSWRELDDDALIPALIEVKGIGRWTAEMFLIFHELRADVLPLGDIGLQRAIAVHYRDGARPTPAAMRDIADSWRPYRSVATWYLWRSLDPIPVVY